MRYQFFLTDMSIAQNIADIEKTLEGTSCRLIAVSKTKPASAIAEAYEAGFRRFGENKVQEMAEKYEQLPQDIEWHLIGHLQTNKVKYIAPFVSLIHSVDSLKLLAEINKQAAKAERTIPCLLQIFIAQEETKFGLSETEAIDLLTSADFSTLENIRVVGLMGMASNTEDEAQIRQEFRGLKHFFDHLAQIIQHPRVQMQELSMGMSGDYLMAAQEGSTLVRVGSAIFGHR